MYNNFIKYKKKCTGKEIEVLPEETITKIPAIGNINNLDDFVPDDELDKSFLEDASHGDIVVKLSKETEFDSDDRYVCLKIL